MSYHRFFLEAPLSGAGGPQELPLTAEDLHHAADVLRVRPGETLVAVEPSGEAWHVRTEEVSRRGVTGVAIERLARVREPQTTLVQGILKGQAMDDVVQHAVELGAECVIPLETERTVVKLKGQKVSDRTRRWERIARGAAAQSQRCRVPVVEPPLRLTELAPRLADFDLAVVLWEDAEGVSGLVPLVREMRLARVSNTSSSDSGRKSSAADLRVAVIVGPEGGLTAREVEALAEAGSTVATLGVAVLRAETAALASLAVVASELGFLGGEARQDAAPTQDAGAREQE